MNFLNFIESKHDYMRYDKRVPRLRAVILTTFIAVSCIAMGLSGCGKQAFVVSSQQAASKAPGNFVIPAKVDILFFEDDTGSMYEARKGINDQIPALLETLQNSGWNYHFAVSPLVKNQGITKAVASKHDSSWGSEWTPAYPGQKANELGMLSPSIFQKPSTDLGIIYASDIDSSYAGKEPGLENIYNTLQKGLLETSGFFRDDALTVVFVLSAGEDTSRTKYCLGNGSNTVSCSNSIAIPGTAFCGDPKLAISPVSKCGFSEFGFDGKSSSAITGFENRFKSLRPTNQMRFYSAVGNGASCTLYGQTFSGSRYAKMSSALNGRTYTLCTQSIGSLFSSLAADLKSVQVAMQTRYLFISADADPATIVVTVTREDGSVEQISQGATDGWTYAGYLENVFTIDSPIPLNKASGYAVELHGNAKLRGGDTANVEFKATGIQNNAK